MKITKENRFDEAIKALVKGFFKGTLAKGNCMACAVGNIVNHSIGQKIETSLLNTIDAAGTFWYDALVPDISSDEEISNGEKEIQTTGYSVDEIRRIERTFEYHTEIDYDDYPTNYKKDPAIIKDQYNGLMAVVEVLCELEGHNEEKLKETKNLFNHELI